MFVSILVSQALLLAIALHAALIGATAAGPVFRALPEGADNFPLRAFFALSLGLSLQIASLFVIGVAGGFYAGPLLGAAAASGALALAKLGRDGALRSFPRWPRHEIALALAFYVVAAAAAARVPGFLDDTMYHLPLARFYAQTGALGLDPWVRFPLFPQNMELLFALAFALRPGDAVLAQGLATLPAFVIVLGLIGAALWLRGSRVLGVAAGIAFLAVHVVDKTLGYAYIDLGLALFSFAAVLGAVLFGPRAPVGVCIALGILGGAAAGCKLHGLVAAALAFVVLLAFRARPAAWLAYLAAAAAFGCGWYLRAYWISGDPISPAGGPWFGYFLWDAQDLAAQRAEQATYLHGVAIYRLPIALIKGGANLLVPALLAPLAARRERRAVLALWGAFVAYALLWFYVSQIDRYLAPVLAIGALLSLTTLFDAATFAMRRLAPRALALASRPRSAAFAAGALLAGYGAYALAGAGAELVRWDTILAGRDGYAVFERANELAPVYGSRLLQIGFEGSAYFYDGTLIGDWFGPGRYRQMVVFTHPPRLIPAARMRETMNRFGARLLAVNASRASFDRADYASAFDILFDDGQQTLLALKSPS